MILDDLFNFAAQQREPGALVSVQATVTTSQTSGLKNPSNIGNLVSESLIYTGGGEINEGEGRVIFTSAKFGSKDLTITAPQPLQKSGTYSILWQGNAFTPTVDGTTNIIYGAAGQQFITIALCYLAANVFVGP